MARIAGVDLPNKKRMEYALTYIFGIGLHNSRLILNATGIDYNKRAFELTEDEATRELANALLNFKDLDAVTLKMSHYNHETKDPGFFLDDKDAIDHRLRQAMNYGIDKNKIIKYHKIIYLFVV